MSKLLRYLKPHIFPIILCLALLFGQAMADLALPDRMSNIVNNGLQQGGVTSPLPEALSAETYNGVMMFLPQERWSEIADIYTGDTGKAAEKFPGVADGGYALRDIDRETRAELEPVFARAFTAYSWIRMAQGDPETATNLMEGVAPEGADFTAMTDEERLAVLQETIEGLDEMVVSQYAVQSVLAEYTALGADMGSIQNRYIVLAGLQMLLLALLTTACSIGVTFLAARVAANVAASLRRDLFEKVESFSLAEFDRFSTASLITRTTNDITQIQGLIVMAIRMVIYAPIMGIGGVVYALEKSTSMTWVIALAVIVMLCLIVLVFSIAVPRFKKIQRLVDRLNLVSRENLSGMMVIRAYNTQEFEENRFDGVNRELTSNNLFINRVMSVMMPVMMFIMNGISLLIIWVGAHQIAASSLQIGDMMAFMQYAMQIIMSFLMISMMFIMLPRASVSAQRVAEVLATEPGIRDSDRPRSVREISEEKLGVVEFKNVYFRFPGAEEDTLYDISFTARPGETTAFIGPTGSGKSTVVNLLPRFYDVTGGSISIGGVDIRDIPQEELRDQIGYVPQKGTLFSGTIASNLRLGKKEADGSELEEAVATAQALDFIREKEGAFESEISQGGSNVSGGQRQRLSIARALVKKPPIYIFDDTFSALDYRTDAELRRALRKTTAGSTQIIVAQRVGTIMHAQQIIVLEDGRIVGRGRHEELMETCDVYREIAESQLRKGEGA